MQRDPVNSANDAKTYAQSGNIQQAIVSLADAVQGIAEYQRYIRNDQLKIKRALNISVTFGRPRERVPIPRGRLSLSRQASPGAGVRTPPTEIGFMDSSGVSAGMLMLISDSP